MKKININNLEKANAILSANPLVASAIADQEEKESAYQESLLATIAPFEEADKKEFFTEFDVAQEDETFNK